MKLIMWHPRYWGREGVWYRAEEEYSVVPVAGDYVKGELPYKVCARVFMGNEIHIIFEEESESDEDKRDSEEAGVPLFEDGAYGVGWTMQSESPFDLFVGELADVLPHMYIVEMNILGLYVSTYQQNMAARP
jgi:hypothetical protein